MKSLRLSVIIPVYNGVATLPRCLAGVRQSSTAHECIVVDDGSTDASASVAASHGSKVISTGGRKGPAFARNRGAEAARGEVLVFFDADVEPHAETLARFEASLSEDPGLAAVMGSYDDQPADPGFISSFKNLMHHFVHQKGRARASSFWAGCSAIRRDVFLRYGGFDESYAQPSIEDIEFGVRLFKAGERISLDPSIQGKHLKIWTLGGLIKTDVFQRGIPWTQLMLRTGYVPNDLNLTWTQRVSAVVAWLAAALLLGGAFDFRLAAAGLVSLAAMVALNREFYSFLATKRGWTFAVAAIPVHLLYYLYSGVAFAAGVAAYAARSLHAKSPGLERCW